MTHYSFTLDQVRSKYSYFDGITEFNVLEIGKLNENLGEQTVALCFCCSTGVLISP